MWQLQRQNICMNRCKVEQVVKQKYEYLFFNNLPVWKTYLASACIKVAGHVGGFVSPGSRFNLNVNSNPNPLGPSVPWHLQCNTRHSVLLPSPEEHNLVFTDLIFKPILMKNYGINYHVNSETWLFKYFRFFFLFKLWSRSP